MDRSTVEILKKFMKFEQIHEIYLELDPEI